MPPASGTGVPLTSDRSAATTSSTWTGCTGPAPFGSTTNGRLASVSISRLLAPSVPNTRGGCSTVRLTPASRQASNRAIGAG